MFDSDTDEAGHADDLPLFLNTTGTGEGDFGVPLAPAAAPPASVLAALECGNYWTTTSLTFGFTTSTSQYESGEAANGELSSFSAFSASGMAIMRSVLAQWDEVSSLNLSEISGGANPVMKIAGSTARPTAWAYQPTSHPAGGDIWVNGNNTGAFFSGSSDPSGRIGSYAYHTALHEAGHALGLDHPHDGASVMPLQYDAMEYTVMSYRSYVGHGLTGYTNETFGFAQSLMMLYIAAIQDIYGADYSTRSGNTTYAFNPTTGEMKIDGVSAGVPGANRIFRTIWDGNGTDTLDFSLYATNISVNLNPGMGVDLDVGGTAQKAQLGYTSGSYVYASYNIYMSLLDQGDTRSLIEGAVCGAGNDILIGNDADNTFCGGLGYDVLTLGAGADTITGTVAELVGDKVTDFTAADRIIGTDLDPQKQLVVGADGLIALADADSQTPEPPDAPDEPSEPEVVDPHTARVVVLTALRDTFASAGSEDVTVAGLGNADRIITRGGADWLIGGDGNDNLSAGAGNDTLEGDTGNDRLDGGDGDDLALGGTGRDTIYGRFGNDRIYGGADADNLRGDHGQDSLSGGAGNDRLDGGYHEDLLYGGAGNDQLRGGNGADTLCGGAGSDTIDGGRGADCLVFHADDTGTDIVRGFRITEGDTLEINNFTGGFEDLQISEYRRSAMITFENGGKIILDRVQTASLTADQFAFHAGDATDRDLPEVTLGGFSDPGAAITSLTDGNDTLRLSATHGMEIDMLAGNDTLTAGRGADTIRGGAGNDYLSGGSGNDEISGGSGADVLFGQSGRDVFVFSASDLDGAETDIVRDFSWKYDRIRLEGFSADSVDDLAFGVDNRRAQLVVDDQTIVFQNLRNADIFHTHDLIDFV